MQILHDLPATNLPSEPLTTGKFRHVRVKQGQYGSISCLFAHQVGRQSQTLVLDETPPNLDRIDFLTCSVITIFVSIKTSQQSNCKRTLIEVEFKPWWLNMLESLMNQPKLSSRKTWIFYIVLYYILISLHPYETNSTHIYLQKSRLLKLPSALEYSSSRKIKAVTEKPSWWVRCWKGQRLNVSVEPRSKVV